MRALAVLHWIVSCHALHLMSMCTNITDKNLIFNQAISEMDATDFKLECSPDDLDIYISGLHNEDIHLNITELISKYNYPVEEHEIITSDGYILTVIRMRKRGKPVLLMHGLLNSADDFVTSNLPNSIAYNLWLDGYDVWIGNARGNKYSRRHVTLSPDTDAQFWNFSWDEIGRIDLTTTIDYILDVTGHSQIIYVGFSQGTTSYFVMCSEKPEYNEKVSLMIALSAVAWMSHLKSPVVRLMSSFTNDLEFLSMLLGFHELLPSDELMKTLTTVFCSQPQLAALICSNVMFALAGYDYEQIDLRTLPVIFGHVPAGASSMQAFHYLQGIRSGKFRKYDHGILKNLAIYGTEEPPDYNVSKITSPVAIFYSDNDWLSNYTDVQILMNQLPNVVDVFHVPFSKFSHLDYMYAKDLKKLVYNKMVELMKKYT